MGGEIEIPASVSSQYISALMMIAPYMEKGLTIKLEGKVVSGTYIDMTVQIMREFGANVRREGAVIRIEAQPYVAIFPGLNRIGVQLLIFLSCLQ